MIKWKHRDEGKRISKAVIKDKSTAELREAKKFLDGLLKLRKSQKLSKTYIEGTKKALAYNENGKIHCDFRFDGTATGRLSCAAYTAGKNSMGVSFHTLPRETENNIRNLFKAPGDWAFIAADYAAMELRILSHIAGEGAMQKAFREGADIHTYTAQLLFNKENITKEERQIAKSVSFLIVYGGGAFNLSESNGIPMKRAEKIISKYANVYPGIFSYMDHVNESAKRDGYVTSIFGRKRTLPDVYSRDPGVVNRALRQALNFTVQSPASDVLLTALLGASRRFKEAGLQAVPVATVHDSIEIVCPKEEVRETASILYDEMVNYPTMREIFNIHMDVPLGVDLEVGTSFGNVEEYHIS